MLPSKPRKNILWTSSCWRWGWRRWISWRGFSRNQGRVANNLLTSIRIVWRLENGLQMWSYLSWCGFERSQFKQVNRNLLALASWIPSNLCLFWRPFLCVCGWMCYPDCFRATRRNLRWLAWKLGSSLAHYRPRAWMSQKSHVAWKRLFLARWRCYKYSFYKVYVSSKYNHPQ